MKRHVLVVGDVNADVIINGLEQYPMADQEVFVNNIQLRMGGSAANVAMCLAKLGTDTTLFASVANDNLGSYIREQLSNAGVQLYASTTAGIEETNQSTGISVAISGKDSRSFISYMGTNACLNTEELDLNRLSQFDHVHLSAYAPSILLDQYSELAKRAHLAGCTTSLDLGWTDEIIGNKKILSLLREIDVFFPNLNEARLLSGKDSKKEAAVFLSNFVRDVVVITNGAEGASAFRGNECIQKSYKVQAVDAVGAGDAFDAGFLHSYIQSRSLDQCVCYGTACGSYVVQSVGGGESSPTEEQLRDFIQFKETEEIYA